MAVRTSNLRISLLQFALIQYVFTVVILVMAVRTGEVSGHVDFMGKDNRGPLLSPVCFPVIECDRVRLRTEKRYRHGDKNSRKEP